MAARKRENIRHNVITVQEYAALAEISTPAISYRIANKRILPGIKNYHYDKTERRYYLERDNMPSEIIKLHFRNS